MISLNKNYIDSKLKQTKAPIEKNEIVKTYDTSKFKANDELDKEIELLEKAVNNCI